MTAPARPRLLYIFPIALNLRAHWADRVRAAAEQGFEVHAAVPFDPSLEGLDLGRATLHDLPLRRGMPSLGGELQLFWRIFTLARSLRPQLLHAVTIRPVVYGGTVARLLRVPAAVFSVTGLGFLFNEDRLLAGVLRPMASIVLRYAFGHKNACVVFENADDRDELVRRDIVSPERTHVFVGGGLDLARKAADDGPERPDLILGIGAGDKQVGCVPKRAQAALRCSPGRRLIQFFQK